MKTIALLIFLFLASFAGAQTKSSVKSLLLSEANPESVGISNERLARIDTMCLEAIKKGDVPGIVALVARKGRIVYYKAFGKSDNQSGKKLCKDDIFRIASQSKAITATAVMMLWEQGKFQLDDPISKYLPDFKNPQVLQSFEAKDSSYTTVPASGEITIRQLLCHTSGVGYGEIDMDERFKAIFRKADIVPGFTTENITIEENIKKLAKLPLHHNPGEKYTYSMGLDILGYFIEVVSGEPFDVFLKDHLFAPLSMNDTGFFLSEDKAARLVPVQQKDDGNWRRIPITFYDPDFPIKGAKRFYSGGGGMVSTAKDYATFLQMYLNGGELNGTRFLSRTTVQFILSNQVGNLFPYGELGLAFGLVNRQIQDMGGQGSDGTFSWGGYFNTLYFADPKEKLIGILLKQTINASTDDTGWKFKILVEQSVDD